MTYISWYNIKSWDTVVYIVIKIETPTLNLTEQLTGERYNGASEFIQQTTENGKMLVCILWFYKFSTFIGSYMVCQINTISSQDW